MRIDRTRAEAIIQRCLELGADEAEIFAKSYRNLAVEIKNQAVDSLTSSRTSGFSVRVIRKHRLGFSYATEPEEADAVVENAIAASMHADEDPNLGMPGPALPSPVEIFDTAVRDITEQDAIGLTMDLEKAAFSSDSRVTKVRKAAGSFTTSETLIVNSLGIMASFESTSCAAQITAVAEAGGDSQMGWDFESSRFLEGVSFERVGNRAAWRAVRLLGAQKIVGCRADVVLDSGVTVDFLGIFAGALSSESVQKGKSLLSGRLGQKVISPLVSIADNGLLRGRTGSAPVDAEGVPTGERMLISEGVLRGYLYNTYTARKDGVASTGNAVRGGYTSLPSVGVTNLYLSAAPGARCESLAGCLAGVSKGLYVLDAMGMHTANPVSGEFSVGVTGLWIENGEIAFAVKEAVISGNILDLFSRVEAIADDIRFYGSIGAPSLRISAVDISA